MGLRGSVLIVLAFLLVAEPARASTIYTSAGVDPNGDPTLAATIDESGTLELRRCPPGGAPCEALPASGGLDAWDGSTRLSAAAGETPAGTVFEAVHTRDGAVVGTHRTPPWLGRVAATSAPGLDGAIAVGGTVGVTPAAWSGGWTVRRPDYDSYDWRSVYVCRDGAGSECTFLDQAPIDARFAGWYLFAVESRQSGTAQGPVACSCSLSLFALPTPRNVVAVSAPIGPVCCVPLSRPLRPDAAAAGPARAAPAASIRKRALRRKGRLVVGRVTCESRCSVRLEVSARRRTVRRWLSAEGAVSLTVPPRHGRLKVRVLVDGKLLASGRTVAR